LIPGPTSLPGAEESSRSRPARYLPAGLRCVAVLLGVSALLWTGVGPALAGSSIGLDRLLTDRAGALGTTETEEVQEALAAVRQGTSGTLNVVLVSGFDDDTGAGGVEQLAAQSDIGSSYVLLAIDVEGHTYQWWLGDAAPWDVAEVEELVTAAAEPQVVAGHWADAITLFAESLQTGEVPSPADEDEDGAAESSRATTTAVVGTAVLVALAGYQFSRRPNARQRQRSGT
jgi:TPM domain